MMNTTYRRPLPGTTLDYFDALAAVEATDEAIVNALVAADPVPTFKPPGGLMPAIDTAALAALFR